MRCDHDTESSSMLQKRISERAYELWVERGRPEGSAEEDWYMAEREIEGPKTAEPEPNQFMYSAAV
jgi:hypothetical protein